MLAFMLARKAAARRAELESEIDKVKRRMEQRRIHAMSQLVLYTLWDDRGLGRSSKGRARRHCSSVRIKKQTHRYRYRAPWDTHTVHTLIQHSVGVSGYSEITTPQRYAPHTHGHTHGMPPE